MFHTYIYIYIYICFPGGSVIKNLPANAEGIRDVGSIPMLGRSPGGGHGNPVQYSFLENPCGWRSLADYSQYGCKELCTTEATYCACMVFESQMMTKKIFQEVLESS